MLIKITSHKYIWQFDKIVISQRKNKNNFHCEFKYFSLFKFDLIINNTNVVYFQGMLMLLYQNYVFKAIGLECVPVIRHLGLLLSHNLSWSDYISSIVEKAYKKLRLLKISSSELDGNICQNCIFHSLDQFVNTP